MTAKQCPLGKKWPGACLGCPEPACPRRANGRPWEPTPDEIAAACEEIQREWSRSVTRQRCGAMKAYEIPVCRRNQNHT